MTNFLNYDNRILVCDYRPTLVFSNFMCTDTDKHRLPLKIIGNNKVGR